MSISYWLDQSGGKEIECDICVIGAGIAGMSTAFWLQKEDPELKIAVIEKNRIGFGASGRNAGFITCGSVEHFNRLYSTHGKDNAAKIWDFSEVNLELLKEHIIQDSTDIGFEQKGSFSLATTSEEFNELRKSADLMKNLNINVDVIEGGDIKKRLGADNFVGGIKYVNDGSINPLGLLNKIKSKFKDNVKVYEQHEVFNIGQDDDMKLIKTDHATFKSNIVVMATNAYSPLLNPYFENKIYPTRGQILITEPVASFMEAPCYANFVLDYFRQLPSGELIIGGFRQLQKDAELGYSDQTSDVIQNALEDFLNNHLPEVKGKKITHRWSGIMGFSADGQPMIGALPDDPQTYFVGGFTAHGIGLAFNAGKTLTDLLFEREIPDFISAKRF